MIADHFIITDFGYFKPGEEIPEEKPIEATGDDEGAVEENAPVEAPNPTKRRKKAN